MVDTKQVNQAVEAEHGIVYALPNDFFGYFGWPTVARMPDGRLVVAASGLRNGHICPFGRNTICWSYDDGKTWTSPRVVNDSPLDDRDSGIISLGGDKLLISWFTTDSRQSLAKRYGDLEDPIQRARWNEMLAQMTDTAAEKYAGSAVRLSDDGGETWGERIAVPINANHGPIQLKSGRLLYFGRRFVSEDQWPEGYSALVSMSSDDGGHTWDMGGSVPLYPGTDDLNHHEPHVAELPDGKLVAHIRLQNMAGAPNKLEDLGLTHFSIMQSESTDGGKTWTQEEPLGFHGSPPHLMLHSSGALVCVYGYRLEPYGQRAAISYDGGQTWAYDYILRDDGPDHDLGYPSSVELADGSILTVYYQKPYSTDDQCGLLWTRWHLPEH
ncbi:MAG: glycoside hydrolase [Anaerolineae bacterium]|nr:glycoside hydrolase [Anaerolineae bacterium]